MSRSVLVASVAAAISASLLGCGGGGDSEPAAATCQDLTGQAISAVACTNLAQMDDCECEKAWKNLKIYEGFPAQCGAQKTAGETALDNGCSSCKKSVLIEFTAMAGDLATCDNGILKGIPCECQSKSKMVKLWDGKGCSAEDTGFAIEAQNQSCTTCHVTIFDNAYPKFMQGCDSTLPAFDYGYPCDCDTAYHNWMAFDAATCVSDKDKAFKKERLDRTCTACGQDVVVEEDKFNRCYSVDDCTNFCPVAVREYDAIYGKANTRGGVTGECASDELYHKFWEKSRARKGLCNDKFEAIV